MTGLSVFNVMYNYITSDQWATRRAEANSQDNEKIGIKKVIVVSLKKYTIGHCKFRSWVNGNIMDRGNDLG